MSPLQEIRHSAAHIMATRGPPALPGGQARHRARPPARVLYYDFDLDHKFTAEDLKGIEAEMKNVVKERQPFERIEVTRDEAENFFRKTVQYYKIGRLADIPDGEAITYYRNGEFTDLCAGTHVEDTGKVRAFKLLNIAGAYHRGSEKNKQLQRIYGTAFPDKKELRIYLHQLEEAKKRDHRKIGKDQRLFHIDDDVGQGLVLWAPPGPSSASSCKYSSPGNFANRAINRFLRPTSANWAFPHLGPISPITAILNTLPLSIGRN